MDDFVGELSGRPLRMAFLNGFSGPVFLGISRSFAWQIGENLDFSFRTTLLSPWTMFLASGHANETIPTQTVHPKRKDRSPFDQQINRLGVKS